MLMALDGDSSTTNCEKYSLLGQTVLPPEPLPIFRIPGFFPRPLVIEINDILGQLSSVLCPLVTVYNFMTDLVVICYKMLVNCARD